MANEKNNLVEIPFEFTELESEVINQMAEERGMDPREVAGIVCAFHMRMFAKMHDLEKR